MRTIDTIPKNNEMAVYPVAGYDSCTLTSVEYLLTLQREYQLF